MSEAWGARGPLVLAVCGLSGSGKTSLAAALSDRSGFPVSSSDETRERLAGRAGDERYGDELTQRTYAELGREAAAAVRRAGGAIVDATFRRERDRRVFLDALGSAAAPIWVECVVPEEVRMERVRRREADPESVTEVPARVAAEQRFEPLPEHAAERHVVVRTDYSGDQVVRDVEAFVARRA